jgi:hypothetical protein
MTLLKSFLILLSILLLTGCSDCFPPNNTSKKSIVFVKGTPYLIPYGALFNTIPIAEDVTVKDYRVYSKLPCKKGDLTWISPSTADTLKEIYRTDGADAFSYAYGEAIRTHHMGCARALSQSEYAYYQTHYGL